MRPSCSRPFFSSLFYSFRAYILFVLLKFGSPFFRPSSSWPNSWYVFSTISPLLYMAVDISVFWCLWAGIYPRWGPDVCLWVLRFDRVGGIWVADLSLFAKRPRQLPFRIVWSPPPLRESPMTCARRYWPTCSRSRMARRRRFSASTPPSDRQEKFLNPG